jgi:hypothetical protein
VKRQELSPAIAAEEEESVPLEEAERILAIPPTPEEIEETMDLVRWFRGRYPTAKERFAYIRRKYAEWTRNPPAPIKP